MRSRHNRSATPSPSRACSITFRVRAWTFAIKQCLGSHGCPVTGAGRFASRIAALAFAERHLWLLSFCIFSHFAMI
jgi:hypothetical protein